MAMKPLFKKNAVQARCDAFMRRVEVQTMTAATIEGEIFVNNARNMGEYENQTSNLRNSIGYGIVQNGQAKAVSSRWEDYGVTGGLVIDRGDQVAAHHIRSLASKYSGRHIALIGVAGMDYAAAVESRGKDVITGSYQITKQRMKVQLEKIRARMNR